MNYVDLIVKSGLASEYSCAGLSDDEIRSVENKLEISFPEEYASFLNQCGKKAGRLLEDTDFFFPAILDLYDELGEMLEEEEVDIELPADIFVFSAYQGCQYLYFCCDGSSDPAVYRITDGGKEPAKVSNSFTEWMKAAIVQYQEAYCRSKGSGSRATA